MTNLSEPGGYLSYVLFKIAFNDRHEFELGKHYEALGLHLSEYHNNDYVRTINLLP